MVPSANQIAKHTLQASHETQYTDSYYNKESPHYKGGAHNVALENIRKGVQPKPKLEAGHSESYYDESSPHYMGGAHNVALARVAAQKTGMDQADVH